MGGSIGIRRPVPAARDGGGKGESPLVRGLLIGVALAFLALVLVLPLILVFQYAFREGLGVYLDSFRTDDARAAIRLTALTLLFVIPANTVFGLAAAWSIAKFRFRGRDALLTLLDLPFAISPVIAGMMFILLLGTRGMLGGWLQTHGIRIIFATPGIVIATLFVTLPLVARELIPLMEMQGEEEEQAALILGASGWQMFWRVTLPNIKWGLLYGVILASARAVGEFGAVSVVSGHIRGETNTIPLHIEILYNDYQTTAAFAMASVLAGLAVGTLAVKSLVEWKTAREIKAGQDGKDAGHGH